MSLLRFKSSSSKTPPNTEHTHHVAGRAIPLKIIENDRAKRMILRIAPRGAGLRVTIPSGLSPREVDQFIARHQGWLEEKFRKIPSDTLVRPGIKIPLRGVAHRIIHESGKRGTVTVSTYEEDPALIVYGDVEHLPRRLADFLKREAKHDIEQLVARHTTTVGRRAKAIHYRDTTSRWGSCTSDGVLSFSWRIMMAPAPVIDYLVAHEVAHLKEMNHGPNFWKLCETLCPDTARCRDWLKRNGSVLQAFRFS